MMWNVGEQKKKSKVLVIGGTGNVGKYIVEASVRLGHQTSVLVRASTAAIPSKAHLVAKFKTLGVSILQGDLYDHESLVKAIKQADVVVSAVSYYQTGDQINIIAAIKKAGTVKRFVPSEFGLDPERIHLMEPAKSAYENMVKIRRAIEAEGIPYTVVSNNILFEYALPYCGQMTVNSLPTDKVYILMDGNTKAIYVNGEDVGTYTMKAVDDPRTLNKILYVRPPANILSHNEFITLWEKKVGKVFERVYIPEGQLLKDIEECPSYDEKINLQVAHSIFFMGDVTNFKIEPSFGVEATQLYPDVKYATVEEHMSYLL